ncbi:MAG: response regulator [Planctomycetota bacterium]
MPSDPIRVLLVEDDQVDADSVGRRLAKSDTLFQIDHHATLVPALKAMVKSLPDVVVLDLGLPDSAGIESLEAIRSSDMRIPIVVLTGWDEVFSVRLRQAGASDYLVKGRLGDGVLERTLKFAVERAELQREIQRLETRVAELRSAPDAT